MVEKGGHGCSDLFFIDALMEDLGFSVEALVEDDGHVADIVADCLGWEVAVCKEEAMELEEEVVAERILQSTEGEVAQCDRSFFGIFFRKEIMQEGTMH